jgi:hypothetical protein
VVDRVRGEKDQRSKSWTKQNMLIKEENLIKWVYKDQLLSNRIVEAIAAEIKMVTIKTVFAFDV